MPPHESPRPPPRPPSPGTTARSWSVPSELWKAKGTRAESAFGELEREELELEEWWSLSHERLRTIFMRADQDADGRISFGEVYPTLTKYGLGGPRSSSVGSLREGSRAQASPPPAPESPRARSLEWPRPPPFGDEAPEAQDLERQVDFAAFVDAARSLMYDQLLPPAGCGDLPVSYSVTDFSDNTCTAGEFRGTREFLRSGKADWARTRWIEARGGEAALKLLGVKFGLHPLALEDALTQSQRPKAERYAEHLHIVAPVFRVGAAAPEDSGLTPAIAIHNVSIFVPLRGGDTLVTFADERAPRHWSGRVRAELRKSYTKLREEGAPFLAYRILDAVVDSTFPVAAAFHRAVAAQRGELRSSGYQSDLGELRALKLDLERLSRLAKPLHRLLTKLIDDKDALLGDRYNSFVRDAVDNVEELQDDFNALLRECEVLDDEFERFHQRRMDRTMYALTVVTCIFLPMQFMTGVYGMNFNDIPEENNPLAYRTFWLCTTAYVALFVAFLGLRECYRRCFRGGRARRRRRDGAAPAVLGGSCHPTRAGGFFKRFLPAARTAPREHDDGARRRRRGDSDLENPLLPRPPRREPALTVV